MKTQNKGDFICNNVPGTNNEWRNFPIDAYSLYSVPHLLPNECYLNLRINELGTNIKVNENMTFKSAFLTIDNQKNFTFNNNSSIIFDGEGATFRTLQTGPPNKVITVNTNNPIRLHNWANVDLNYTTFNSSSSWQGIKLDSTRLDIIKNCTFNSGAPVYIDMFLTRNSGHFKKVITDNTFTNGKVKITNTFQCNILRNNFTWNTTSDNLLEITNYINATEPDGPGGGTGLLYNINICDNYFTGGAYQLQLYSFAANKTPFYISGNNFAGAQTQAGLSTFKISGDFKNNKFINNSYFSAVRLLESNLNFYNNTPLLSNNNATLNLQTPSTARLAPVLDIFGNLLWYGGKNKLYTDNGNNIYFTEGSDLFVGKGENCFYRYNSSYTHITGSLPTPCFMPTFDATRNYWNTEPPVFNITCDGNPANVTYQPRLNECMPTELAIVGYQLTDRGDGIIDTVVITQNFPGGGSQSSGNEDAILYSQGLKQKSASGGRNFTASILSFKLLLNSHNQSKFLRASLDEIYQCYIHRDTTGNQNNTNILFTELKNYLEQRMQQYQNNPSFVERAYDYYLMCLVRLRKFTEAIAGYENIMQNHHNPYKRLTASWDRAAVVLLMNGGGGGNSSSKFKVKSSKLLDNKPAHQIATETFKNVSDRVSESNDNTTIGYTEEEAERINQIVIEFNPVNFKELDKKISDDIKVLMSLNSNSKANLNNSSLPKQFKLHQNYPNPFNPVTTVKYDLPKDGFVGFKIYDVSGREVYTTGEFRKAGSYEITFDGSVYSSGVYFYKIEAGEFVETKKMVLIK